MDSNSSPLAGRLDGVAETARERTLHAVAVSKQAAVSKAYLYPPLGAAYLLYHPSLWPPVLKRLLPCVALSAGVITGMFLFTYVPQAAALSLMNGPMGPINAVVLVLSESSTVINWLARTFLLQGALVDLFDATLVCEGQESLVEKGRELKTGGSHDGAKRLGKALTQPMQKFTFRHLVEYVMLLPLNMVPMVGTIAFLVIQGRLNGPGWHSRYFQLKEFNESTRDNWVKERKGGYVAFGTIAMVMNLIPLASIIFTFTSTVGAALWAAEIEKKSSFPGESVDVTGMNVRKDQAELKVD